MDRRRVAKVAAVYVALATLVVYVALKVTGKRATGVTCGLDEECRSGHCIHLMTARPGQPTQIDGLVCTARCDTDRDCPSSMACPAVDQEWQPSVQLAFDLPEGKHCVPRGYERASPSLRR